MDFFKYLPRRRGGGVDDPKGSAIRRRKFRPHSELSALVDALREQGCAALAEEQREDRSKRTREWITIVLLAGTMIAIGWQVFEMRRTYRPIAQQATATAQSAAAAKEAAEAAVRQVKDAESSLGASPTGVGRTKQCRADCRAAGPQADRKR